MLRLAMLSSVSAASPIKTLPRPDATNSESPKHTTVSSRSRDQHSSLGLDSSSAASLLQSMKEEVSSQKQRANAAEAALMNLRAEASTAIKHRVSQAVATVVDEVRGLIRDVVVAERSFFHSQLESLQLVHDRKQ